jgi:hypothetical protein
VPYRRATLKKPVEDRLITREEFDVLRDVGMRFFVEVKAGASGAARGRMSQVSTGISSSRDALTDSQ